MSGLRQARHALFLGPRVAIRAGHMLRAGPGETAGTVLGRKELLSPSLFKQSNCPFAPLTLGFPPEEKQLSHVVVALDQPFPAPGAPPGGVGAGRGILELCKLTRRAGPSLQPALPAAALPYPKVLHLQILPRGLVVSKAAHNHPPNPQKWGDGRSPDPGDFS